MQPKGRNSYRMSYRNPVAADLPRIHAMEFKAVEINTGSMQSAPHECEHLLDGREKSKPCMQRSPPLDRISKPAFSISKWTREFKCPSTKHQEAEPLFHVQGPAKHIHSCTGKCLTLFHQIAWTILWNVHVCECADWTNAMASWLSTHSQ